MRPVQPLASILPLLAIACMTAIPARLFAAATPTTTVTVLEVGAPDTLNPLLTRTRAGIDATAPVFDSLVRSDAKGGFQPDLALRWARSTDGLAWTFTLNPRARWHDGEPVTAQDVAFTVRAVRDVRFGAPSTQGFDHVASITIRDAHTLTMNLRGGYAPLLATVGVSAILPAHVFKGLPFAQIRSYAPFNHHPIGSGPFTVASDAANGQVVEEANPDYFGPRPHIDRLVITPVGTRAAALAAARHADLSVVPPAADLNPGDPAETRSGGAQRTLYSPSFAWTHIDLIEHGPLANPLVRQALALAAPRNRIVAQVLHGHGRLCDGDQAPGTPAYAADAHGSYRYNLPRARGLLRRAGFTRLKNGLLGLAGSPLVIDLWGDASCAQCVAALHLVAQGWRSLGIYVPIHVVPTAALFGPNGPLYSPGRFQMPRYDAVLYTWINGPDPDDSSYWTSGAIVTPSQPFGANFDGYANPTVDALAARAITTVDAPVRMSLYRQIQRILVADEPDIFLYWSDAISIVPRRLHGYAPNPYAQASTWNASQWAVVG